MELTTIFQRLRRLDRSFRSGGGAIGRGGSPTLRDTIVEEESKDLERLGFDPGEDPVVVDLVAKPSAKTIQNFEITRIVDQVVIFGAIGGDVEERLFLGLIADIMMIVDDEREEHSFKIDASSERGVGLFESVNDRHRGRSRPPRRSTDRGTFDPIP